MPLKNGVKNKNQISNGVNKGILSHGVNMHVSNKTLGKIINPLDHAIQKQNKYKFMESIQPY